MSIFVFFFVLSIKLLHYHRKQVISIFNYNINEEIFTSHKYYLHFISIRVYIYLYLSLKNISESNNKLKYDSSYHFEQSLSYFLLQNLFFCKFILLSNVLPVTPHFSHHCQRRRIIIYI